MHNKTPTEIRLTRLGYFLASRCSICCQEKDSSCHFMFHCEQAKSLWKWIFQSTQILAPWNLSASSIWEALSRGNDQACNRHMATIFINVIHSLWKARNIATFEARKIPLSTIQQQLQETLSFYLGKISKLFCSNQLRSILLFLSILVVFYFPTL